jgi:hypothetical protein
VLSGPARARRWPRSGWHPESLPRGGRACRTAGMRAFSLTSLVAQRDARAGVWTPGQPYPHAPWTTASGSIVMFPGMAAYRGPARRMILGSCPSRPKGPDRAHIAGWIAACRCGCQTDHVDLSEFLSRPQLRPGEARLPWDDQEFSARMLAEHLDDRHDMASRRGSLIDRHVCARAAGSRTIRPPSSGGGSWTSAPRARACSAR